MQASPQIEETAYGFNRLIDTHLPIACNATATRATVEIQIKDKDGWLLPTAIPFVSIVKDGGYAADAFGNASMKEADLAFLIGHRLESGRLCGFVIERLVPYGAATSELRASMLRAARFQWGALVRVGRGCPEGFGRS